MSAHQIQASLLTFGERRTLKSIIRAKVGQLTVREAREFMNPTGLQLWVTAIGCALLTAFIGVVLSVWLILFAPVMLVGAPYQAMLNRKRWLTLLPPERDADFVEVLW